MKNLLFPALMMTLLLGCQLPDPDDLGQGNESGNENPIPENPSPDNPSPDNPPAGEQPDQSSYPPDRVRYVSIERPADLPMPAFGESVIDPVSGTRITRITDGPDSCWTGSYPKHDYSKAQPWNADQSMYRFSAVAIYDANSYEPIRCLPNLYVAKWSHLDPHVIYAFRPNQRRILRYNTESEVTEEIIDLSDECDYMALGPGEGNTDINDQRVALACRVNTADPEISDLRIIVVNLQSGEVTARRTMPGAWSGQGKEPGLIDWLSISQKGDYVVIMWDHDLHSENTVDENGEQHYGIEVYDTDTLTYQRRLWHYGNHGDLCIDSAGDEAFVQFNGPDGGRVNMYRLRDGEYTGIITDSQNPDGDIYADFYRYQGHISCRNTERPGWAYVSTEYRPGIAAPETVGDGAVLAVKLDGSGTVEHWGHHQTSATNYRKSPMPVPSPDGTKVMFTSDWGNSQDEDLSYEFVIDVPPSDDDGADSSALMLLKSAGSWMYQIEDLWRPGAVEVLAASNYPLLVIEPTYTMPDENNFDIKGTLQSLHKKPDGGKRLVLAYINIGQAEDYRSYWQSDWKAPGRNAKGVPDFMISVDPDGWSGNYPVAYWDSRWQDIWLGENGMVAELARHGFDGVYLDWIGAYEEDPVVREAQRAGIEVHQEMVDFIARIRTAGKAVDSDFLVVAQNAPYLIDEASAYAQAIDALAVEDTWFSGRGDAGWNQAGAGDIPNKYTDEFSTTALLAQYRKYQELGLPVFSVDYSRKRANARQVYQDAHAAGLIPLVTRISLSRITETPP